MWRVFLSCRLHVHRGIARIYLVITPFLLSPLNMCNMFNGKICLELVWVDDALIHLGAEMQTLQNWFVKRVCV